MRLINTLGTIDVPYETGSLSIGYRFSKEQYEAERKIYFINYHNSYASKGQTLAEYSSKEKALKVMEMLREEYLETVYDYRTRPKVFKFLDDSEVEV